MDADIGLNRGGNTSSTGGRSTEPANTQGGAAIPAELFRQANPADTGAVAPALSGKKAVDIKDINDATAQKMLMQNDVPIGTYIVRKSRSTGAFYVCYKVSENEIKTTENDGSIYPDLAGASGFVDRNRETLTKLSYSEWKEKQSAVAEAKQPAVKSDAVVSALKDAVYVQPDGLVRNALMKEDVPIGTYVIRENSNHILFVCCKVGVGKDDYRTTEGTDVVFTDLKSVETYVKENSVTLTQSYREWRKGQPAEGQPAVKSDAVVSVLKDAVYTQPETVVRGTLMQENVPIGTYAIRENSKHNLFVCWKVGLGKDDYRTTERTSVVFTDLKSVETYVNENKETLTQSYAQWKAQPTQKPDGGAAVAQKRVEEKAPAPSDATTEGTGVVRSYSGTEQLVVEFVERYLHDYITGKITQNDVDERSDLIEKLREKFGETVDGKKVLSEQLAQVAEDAFLEAAAMGLYVNISLKNAAEIPFERKFTSKKEDGEEKFSVVDESFLNPRKLYPERKPPILEAYNFTTQDEEIFKIFEDGVKEAFPKVFPTRTLTHEKLVTALANANARRTESHEDIGHLTRVKERTVHQTQNGPQLAPLTPQKSEVQRLIEDDPIVRRIINRKGYTTFQNLTGEFDRSTLLPDIELSKFTDLSDAQATGIITLIRNYLYQVRGRKYQIPKLLEDPIMKDIIKQNGYTKFSDLNGLFGQGTKLPDVEFSKFEELSVVEAADIQPMMASYLVREKKLQIQKLLEDPIISEIIKQNGYTKYSDLNGIFDQKTNLPDTDFSKFQELSDVAVAKILSLMVGYINQVRATEKGQNE